MTILKLSETLRITLKHIDCIPVWKENNIELFDMYDKTTGEWLGSKRTLRYCEEFDELRSKL